MLLSLALAAAGALASRRPAAASPSRRAASPPKGPRRVTLPSPDNPLVAIRLLFQVGAADDPAGKDGLAALTAAMLGSAGTQRRSWAEVLDALYPMAADIQTYGDKDAFVFEGTVHRDNLAAFADLLAEQILTPRFAIEDFTRHRQDALDFITKTLRGNDDEDLGKQALAALMFEGHPYGHPTAGTVAGLHAITLDDVRQFYAGKFTQDRLIVGVAGGYPDGFPETFVARFSVLPARSKPRQKLPPAPARSGGGLIVEKDARANAVSMGHPLDITRADDDFYPLYLAGSYLGEHRTFNGVLMVELRQKRGLNYGDYAYVENFIQDGGTTFPLTNIARRQQHFEIWLRPVAPQATTFAIRAALFELDKLVHEGIPAAGLQATREFLLHYVDLWAQDPSRRLGFAMDALSYGKDVIAELKARLPKMTKVEVDRAIRKHLDPKRLTVAIVSDNAKALRAELLSGKSTPMAYDTKDTPAEVLERDKAIERYPLPVTPNRVKIVPAGVVFEK
ncbi:MAG TPA: pitrilysin family protein [Polyangia bacterium]|nr:pitrilysin family protein [Polyangia bacterium]